VYLSLVTPYDILVTATIIASIYMIVWATKKMWKRQP
jgi:hypothetical protein